MTGEHRELRKRAVRARVLTARGEEQAERFDRLAAEEPMEIRVHGPGQEPDRVAVTMRTPGDDFELAVGFLATEGLVGSADEIATVGYCRVPDGPEAGEQEYNVVTVSLRRRWDQGRLRRNFYATSSCGICGKAALEEVEVHCDPLAAGPVVTREALLGLPDALRGGQRVFDATGGLHAAGLFDAEGRLSSTREDVGRHNALDKLVGEAFLARRLPLAESVVMVSGRASFEIVQKAAVAGVPVVCAVSAPSSLAVDAADRLGMTLVGFLRGEGFNVYTHPERIVLDGTP